MFPARSYFALIIFSACLVFATAAPAVENPHAKRGPLVIYATQACDQEGVNFAYYEGAWNGTNFGKAKPVAEGKLEKLDLSPAKRNDNFGIKFTGFIKVEAAGVVEFWVRGDDGAKLYVDSKIVVDSAGKENNYAETKLSEGVHPITIDYYQGGGSKDLDVTCRMPLPWHVKESQVRIPVDVIRENAWARMPPQEYLADLNPIRRQELSFDRNTKMANRRDVRSPEDKARIIKELQERCRRNNQQWNPDFYRLHGNPIMRARGSATYRVKPEYKWISFWSHGHCRIMAGDKELPGVIGGQHEMNPGDPRFPREKESRATIVPIPPDTKEITITADAEWIRQAGFLTKAPTVARVALCVNEQDPTTMIPLVYDADGNRVGCRILWAHPGEPISILFDCSSGNSKYFVYFVNRSSNPQRLQWIPKAGLIFESRYPSCYDASVETVDGFMKLWNDSEAIGEKVEMTRIWKVFFPLRPFYGTTPNYRSVLNGAQMNLSIYAGFFNVPEKKKYQFHYRVDPAGYFLIDNQLVSQMKFHEAHELQQKGSDQGYQRFEVELEKGLHRIELCQYGNEGRFSTRLGWGMPGNEADLEPLGSKFTTWEPVANATAHPVDHGQRTDRTSFIWSPVRQCLSKYPAHDIVCYSFTGRMPNAPEGAVFRWRFDDGSVVVGQREEHGNMVPSNTVEHYFLSPGIRDVKLEVLDGPDGKVIATASGKVHVHVKWAWPEDADRWRYVMPMIDRRADEFATVTPIEEVVSLYYWALHNQWPELRKKVGSALARRATEIVDKYSYTRLLEMGKALADPRESHYAAAERSLEAVMARAPTGGRHWRDATLALAEIRIAGRGEPESGLLLLNKLQNTKPAADMSGNWKIAHAKQWHCLTAVEQISGNPGGLEWSDTAMPFSVEPQEGRGIWLAKDIKLPPSQRGKELVIELSKMPTTGYFWFNGKPVGRPWRWPDGQIAVPPELQRPGEMNRFTALFQPPNPPSYYAKTPAPKLEIAGPLVVPAPGYEFPTPIYTSKACDQPGVNYAYYKGTWDKLPEFPSLQPAKEGTLERIDLSPADSDNGFAIKFTGFIKVESEGNFTFTTAADDGCRLYIDSHVVIDNDGSHSMNDKPKGEIQLSKGVHSLTLTYFQKDGDKGLEIVVPNSSMSAEEIAIQRTKVDALLGLGKNEEAKKILLTMKPDAWPMPEKARLNLTSDLRRTDAPGALTDTDTAETMATVDSWLHKHPMLRMDPEFMSAKIEAYVEMGDYARAFTLAGQMRQVDMNETQRRQLMLVQVRSRIKAGQMDKARDIYKELKKIAPYSTATVEAREAIKDAILREE